MKTVGSRLRYVRKHFGLLQYGFIPNLTQSAVSYMEKDERELTHATLQYLANKYKVNLNWLITGQGEPFSVRILSPLAQIEGLKKKPR